METFLQFLRDHQLSPRIPESVSEKCTLEDAISSNFFLLNDGMLRELIACAIDCRNKQLAEAKSSDEREILGPWGEIIDAMKTVLAMKQQLAAQNFEKILELGRSGDKKGLTAALTKLSAAGCIDYLFRDVLKDTLEKCQASGYIDFVAMLQFVSAAIDKIDAINAARKIQQQQQLPATPTPTSAPTPTPAATVVSEPVVAKQSKEKATEATSSANQLTNLEQPSVSFTGDTQEESVIVAGATAVMSDETSSMLCSDDIDDEEEDSDDVDSVDSDDEDENQDALLEEDRFAGNEVILIETNEFLQSTIKSCNGDAKDLKTKIITACRSGQIDSMALLRVLKDNLLAAERAQYTVKLKLLSFIKDFLYEEIYGTPSYYAAKANSSTANSSSSEDTSNSGTIDLAATTHHAPKFVDSNPITAAELEILFPSMFLDGSQCKAIVCPDSTKIKKKNKKLRKLANSKFLEVAANMAKHYEEFGWAACDNFLPMDLVRQIRIEAGIFDEDYEQSEIWVGKQADVGAHLVVPSVRGDKVLWMCGNHLTTDSAPEGVTRTVKTYGEIEPCRLDVKAKAPLRRFHALKTVASAMNNFVEALKVSAPSLAGIYERSDCMLAVYPGNGSRFARHIDNTTNDGRKLTMLVYLNPGWTPELGGCLRLTPPSMSGQAVDVLPMCGRLAIFSSDTVPHEVMPTFGDRHSLTIWYYDKEERQQAIARAREAGHAEAVAKSSIETQREAKKFIADLMGGDEVGADGGNPTEEDLRVLAVKARELTSDALKIVASITGAPSEESFRKGFDLLKPPDLKSMRQLFRRMGLQE